MEGPLFGAALFSSGRGALSSEPGSGGGKRRLLRRRRVWCWQGWLQRGQLCIDRLRIAWRFRSKRKRVGAPFGEVRGAFELLEAAERILNVLAVEHLARASAGCSRAQPRFGQVIAPIDGAE